MTSLQCGLELLYKAAILKTRHISKSEYAIIVFENDFYLVQLLQKCAVYLKLVDDHFEIDKDSNGNSFYCLNLPKSTIMCKGRLVNGLISKRMLTDFYRKSFIRNNISTSTQKIAFLLTKKQRHFCLHILSKNR